MTPTAYTTRSHAQQQILVITIVEQTIGKSKLRPGDRSASLVCGRSLTETKEKRDSCEISSTALIRSPNRIKVQRQCHTCGARAAGIVLFQSKPNKSSQNIPLCTATNRRIINLSAPARLGSLAFCSSSSTASAQDWPFGFTAAMATLRFRLVYATSTINCKRTRTLVRVNPFTIWQNNAEDGTVSQDSSTLWFTVQTCLHLSSPCWLCLSFKLPVWLTVTRLVRTC